MTLLLTIMISTAHAGWFHNFCERHLIAWDPYEFETYPRDWIEREIVRLDIKANWCKLDHDESVRLKNMKRELRVRESILEAVQD